MRTPLFFSAEETDSLRNNLEPRLLLTFGLPAPLLQSALDEDRTPLRKVLCNGPALLAPYHDIDEQGFVLHAVAWYCEELVLGGYDDWRLPDIDELRTIIRGNPDTMTGGDCPVHDGSSRAVMKNPACGAVAE